MSGPGLHERAFAGENLRWAVVKDTGLGYSTWLATAPTSHLWDDRNFGTQSEAIAYADAQARRVMPGLAQIAQAEAAQDAELDGFTADAAAWDEANVNDALRRRP